MQFRLDTHTVVCKIKMQEMDKFLRNLSELILEEIGKKNCTYAYFADICGIHRNELSDIINMKRKDMSVSTVFKICNSTGISMADLFEIEDDEIFDRMLKRLYLTDGKRILRIRV